MAAQINFKPFKEFLRSGQVGSVLLMAAVILSLLIANTGGYDKFLSVLNYSLGFTSPGVAYTISVWINDGLMSIFFLLVGLEIKREIIEGELSSFKKAILPLFAATGGMIVPAGIFYFLNSGTPTANGWGIPMATDIAFALAILSLLGNRVPASLKIFLAALAIADDLGAILIIAVFYSKGLQTTYLLYAAGLVGALSLMNILRAKKLIFYVIPGFFLWYCIHHSGIHATISGVLLAFCIPTNPVKAESPLEYLEHKLMAPVNYLIMPLFALANTNIRFHNGMLEGLTSSLSLGIISGLFIGKTLGVTCFSYIAVRLGIAKLPEHCTWKHITGLGMLAGIGFTMSVFIALLSFNSSDLNDQAKFSILIASLLSGVIGYAYLNRIHRKSV